MRCLNQRYDYCGFELEDVGILNHFVQSGVFSHHGFLQCAVGRWAESALCSIFVVVGVQARGYLQVGFRYERHRGGVELFCYTLGSFTAKLGEEDVFHCVVSAFCFHAEDIVGPALCRGFWSEEVGCDFQFWLQIVGVCVGSFYAKEPSWTMFPGVYSALLQVSCPLAYIYCQIWTHYWTCHSPCTLFTLKKPQLDTAFVIDVSLMARQRDGVVL